MCQFNAFGRVQLVKRLQRRMPSVSGLIADQLLPTAPKKSSSFRLFNSANH